MLTHLGTPSSEVTGPVCLVPKREFARAPEDILLAYLCRFTVRTRRALTTRVFLAAELGHFARLTADSYSVLGINGPPDLPGEPPYDLEPTHPIVGRLAFLRHLFVDNAHDVVQEY